MLGRMSGGGAYAADPCGVCRCSTSRPLLLRSSESDAGSSETAAPCSGILTGTSDASNLAQRRRRKTDGGTRTWTTTAGQLQCPGRCRTQGIDADGWAV